MKALIIILALFSLSLANEAEEKKAISKSMGHMIQENLEELGIDLDLETVIEGMKEAKAGKPAPYNEEKCFEAIAEIQKKELAIEETNNLAEAEKFLMQNSKQKSVISLENGKLQYTVKHIGKGRSLKEYHRPSMRYSLQYLDKSVVAQSEENEIVDLDQVIPGFKKGVLGMKEGEKRVLFIHPTLSEQSGLLRPNSLLIIEVELLEVDPQTSRELAEKDFSTTL